MSVGFSTVKAVWGNKIAPTLLDQYLARTGYQSQQTDELEDPDRPDNLWEPVPGDHGAHGSFDDRAEFSTTQLKANMNREWLVAGGIGVGLLLAMLGTRRH